MARAVQTTMMAETLSDLELVEEAIRALDQIPPVQRSIPPGEDGLSRFYDAGPLIAEFKLLAALQEADDRVLKARRFANGQELDPDSERSVRERFDARERNNPWGVIPWGRERLSRLLTRHLDQSVYPQPHAGFHGPRAGHGLLSSQLAPSTAVDWLIYCPQRCRACVNVCRGHLGRLRRSLAEEDEARKRTAPAISWRKFTNKKNPNIVRVEVFDGTRRVELKMGKAELFLAAAAKSPRSLSWEEVIRFTLGEAEIRVKSKSARQRPGGEPSSPRVALREESVARRGRAVRKELGTLGSYWHQTALGVTWSPPEGSGPID